MGRLYLKAGCRHIPDILNTANELLQSCRAGKKSKSHVLWSLTQTAHPTSPEVQEKIRRGVLNLCITVGRARGESRQCLARAVGGQRR